VRNVSNVQFLGSRGFYELVLAGTDTTIQATDYAVGAPILGLRLRAVRPVRVNLMA